MGRTEEALEKLTEALEHMQCSGLRMDEAETLAIKGEILLKRGRKESNKPNIASASRLK